MPKVLVQHVGPGAGTITIRQAYVGRELLAESEADALAALFAELILHDDGAVRLALERIFAAIFLLHQAALIEPQLVLGFDM